MRLSEVLKNTKPVSVRGSLDIEISGVEMDSRAVKQGDLFVAVRGTQTDGHRYIDAALKGGAVAVLCEEIPADCAEGITYVLLQETWAVVGSVATLFYGDPTRKLRLVGVTGTNGKTTIATLLYETFRKLGYRCGLCSTVCNYVDGQAYPTSQTTPDPITLNRLLGQMVVQGCQYAFMEVSSHAVSQQRISGLRFAGGIFTNLTRDHLDYHKTFENYRDAKKMFFDNLSPEAFALVNADDRNGMFMVQNSRAMVKTYSWQRLADFHAKILEMNFQGMLLQLNGSEMHVPLVGKFNVSNLLAIYGAALLLGAQSEEVLTVLSTLHSVSGRFETLLSPRGYVSIVDYAHTPDALRNVLQAIHEVLRGRGSVITVCGAGGNRDKGKRPLMAHEAAIGSDRVILTSDNPRFEDPADILRDMMAGITQEEQPRVLTLPDRREAIRVACQLARRGDVVLVAGKGHEDYQEIQGVKHHFDDREIIREVYQSEEPLCKS